MGEPHPAKTTRLPILPSRPGALGSFTRFVLPFAYRPELWKRAGTPDQHFDESFCVTAEEMAERRAYFTADTGMILFGRTKWFVLKGEATQHTICGRDGKQLSIVMPPPRLVLPEWPVEVEAAHPRAAKEVLRTGFLLIDVQFLNVDSEWDLRDLLAFNETFRYWRRPWVGLETATREGYRYCDMVPDFDASDPFFGRWEKWLRVPVKVGGQYFSLAPGAEDGTLWFEEARHWQETSEGKPGWIPYSDNRTFVWTCAMLQDEVTLGRQQDYGIWVKLLNVDPPEELLGSCSQFERGWAEERTYYRWAEKGTTYGFSYHSGVVLTPASNSWLPGHFSRIYFDLILLLFYLRITCFRFSRELCEVSEHLPLGERAEGAPFIEEMRRLRLAFALLTNLYEFPLLSNQQQAMELYALAKKHLDIAELFQETSEKIRTSHEFVEMQLAHEQNQQILNLTEIAHQQDQQILDLTKVAQYGLVLVLVVTFFGTEPLRDWIRPRYVGWARTLLDTLHRNPYYASALGDIAAAILFSLAGGFVFHWFLKWLLSHNRRG